MVTEVATHENESVGTSGRTCKASQMTNGMAWRIKEVERTVAKEVKPPKGSDHKGFLIKVDFSKVSPYVVNFPDRRIRVSRVSRTKGFLEALSNNKLCGIRERRNISDMVEMMMASPLMSHVGE
jgi:hypothetical protein